MKLIVGLGNPGAEHENNRHNVGFMMVDQLAGEIDWGVKFDSLLLKSGDLILAKPMTFMNRSGEAVSRITGFYKIGGDNLYVAHDDLDLRLGEFKIQKGVGPKVHRGLSSIEEKLGTKDFWRLRIGIDNRPSGEARTAGEEYVLADFSAEERGVVDRVMTKLGKELKPE